MYIYVYALMYICIHSYIYKSIYAFMRLSSVNLLCEAFLGYNIGKAVKILIAFPL